MQNTEKEKIITIEAELPIPLGELAIYALPKKEDASSIVELLENKPHVANFIIEKIIREIIRKKKLNLKLLKVEYDYSDSNSIDFGIAYFKVKIEGTEKALRKIAGEDKVFEYDWEEHEKTKLSLIKKN